MDELVRHCIREIAFDGDLGSNVSRLREFVTNYYGGQSTPDQKLDDAFHAFVYSLVVQQPCARVGILPSGLTTEVYIAPQPSAVKKGKAKAEFEEDTLGLELIPDAKTRSLDSVLAEYGSDLRIAIEPEQTFAAITGSHIRPQKLTPMVYSALQLITRGRDDGITVVELGKRSQYDQKTCFYLVKQLIELNLIAKVRCGGVGSNLCIHKHFYNTSPRWKEVREEEAKAQDLFTAAPDAQVEQNDDAGPQALEDLGFTPIDARHLSSLPLIKARVIKLLKASHNYIHASNNMLLKIGFVHPNKTDRRFFNTRIRELIQMGLIEAILVPSRRKGSVGKMIKCFRLITPDSASAPGEAVPAQLDDDEIEKDEPGQRSGLRTNMTLHKQIIDLLEEAGTSGMIMNELSSRLGDFDKRTIELLLSRAEKQTPPSHLSDLGVAIIMENYGRERRNRYFTVASYRQLLENEKLDPTIAGYGDANSSDTLQGFANVSANMFYEDVEALVAFHDAFLEQAPDAESKKTKKKGKKTSKPATDSAEGNAPLASATKPKRISSKAAVQEQMDAEPQAGAEQTKRGRKRKANDDTGQPPPKRNKRSVAADVPPLSVSEPTQSTSTDVASVANPPRKRGRTKKAETLATSQILEPPPLSVTQPPQPTADIPDISGQHANVEDPVGLDVPHQVEEVNPKKRHRSPPSPDHLRRSRRRTAQAPVILENQNDLPPDAEPSALNAASSTPAGQAMATILTDPSPVVQVIDPILVQNSSVDPPNGVIQQRATKANVSHMRRGNEFLQLITNFGGIVNVNTKDFADAHLALIDRLSQANEPTSAPPGTRVDKRTVTSTLDAMESKGRIKMIKTHITTRTGVPRPTTVVHLPDVDDAKLNDFLSNLCDTAPIPSSSNIRRIEEQVEYGSASLPDPRRALPLQLMYDKEPGGPNERWSKNDHRAEQLWQYDDETIRDVLLTERTTLAQYYGYIAGRAARLRKAHLVMLNAFEHEDPSPYIVSHQDRIFHVSFFNQDLPLDVHLSLCAALTHNDALSQFYRNDANSRTPVKDLPPALHTLLQVNRSRARSRFLDIMQALMFLQLVTPLRPSDSPTPAIRCPVKGEHPGSFVVMSGDWNPSTPNLAPNYWQFKSHILFPPLLRSQASSIQNMDVLTEAQALEFWTRFKDVCLNKAKDAETLGSGTIQLSPLVDRLVISLRRAASWDDRYFLTWHQKQYLERALLNESQELDIARLAWIVSAPEDTVTSFLDHARGRYDKVATKVRLRRERLKAEKAENDANKALLADMAAEGRAHRENEWDAIVARVHPEPLNRSAEVRLRPVRKMFLQAVSIKNIEKWEEEIRQTLKEAALAASNLLAKRAKKLGQVPVAQSTSERSFLSPPIIRNPAEKTVAELIAQQGPAIPEDKKTASKKRKRGKKDQEEEPQPSSVRRRHRFQWDNDYEELARDASVIIKARCRDLPRLDLAALDQVFPSVPRNTVRQRLVHIRDSPGNEAYLKRLEDKWYEFWVQHRGTALLPDHDPQSASDFDLPNHIEVLRKHIDKNALRVGFTTETSSITLPENVEDLLSMFEVTEQPVAATSWDFVWKGDAEEGREKALAQQPFCKSYIIPTEVQDESNMSAIAEAAVKMVFGTPNELYDPEAAANLLREVGEEVVSSATKNLLARGVLSKHVRDPKKEKPGRRLKIADANQNALGGSVASDTFQDAIALDEDVEFRVDTSAARAARNEVEWNSKKADDDQIETSIDVRFLGTEAEVFSSEGTPLPLPPGTVDNEGSEPDEVGHGKTRYGDVASCRRIHPGVTLSDCQLCVARDHDKVMSALSQEEANVVQKVLGILDEQGEKGVHLSDLWGRLAGFSLKDTLELVYQLTDNTAPLAFVAGYAKPVVVSIHHLRAWSVLVSGSSGKRVLPRRWLDISGNKVGEVWDAALRAVISLVHFRPGVTKAELGWRLRGVYDKQEINDVLTSLCTDGFVRIIRGDLGLVRRILDVDNAIEESTYCFIDHEKHCFNHYLRNEYTMRAKDVMEYVPIMGKLKLVADRITFSRLTIGYFLFSFAHFVVQIAIQAKAFTINATAASFLWDIVLQARTTSNSFPVFKGSKFSLCDTIPSQISTDNCQLLWDGTRAPSRAESAFDVATTSQPAPVTSPIVSQSESIPPTPSAPVSLASVVSALSSTSAFARPTSTVIETVIARPTSSPVVALANASDESDESNSESDSASDSDSDVESFLSPKQPPPPVWLLVIRNPEFSPPSMLREMSL
ncbi:hypothetical protein ONZ45_g5742 [Pleurotus djamor]|nr:hypothetical protein ONZ45_g5742 [Pleurotus djamor]